MSRLPFAPATSAMEVTDIRAGRFVFPPREDVPISFEGLERAITGAGYEIERTGVEVTGVLGPEGALHAAVSGQPFVLAGDGQREGPLEEVAPGATVTVSGEWRAGEAQDTILVERWAEGEALPGPPGGGPS